MLHLRSVSWFGAMQQAETGRSRPGEAEIGGGYKEDPCLLSREKKIKSYGIHLSSSNYTERNLFYASGDFFHLLLLLLQLLFYLQAFKSDLIQLKCTTHISELSKVFTSLHAMKRQLLQLKNAAPQRSAVPLMAT